MQTVFVTGASGFIGRHVVQELLRRDLRLKCLVRGTSQVAQLQDPRIERITGTIEQPDSYRHALEGCDTVLHIAGLVTAMRAQELLDINGTATGNLARACRALRQPPRLVYVSSVAATGPPPPGKAVRDESDAPSPVSNYGRSKRLGEIELQKEASGLEITVIRPGIVYGPADVNLLKMIKPIYRFRVHAVIGFRTPPLSLIYVDDLVQILLTAATTGETLAPQPHGEYSPQGYYFACDDAEYPNYWELGQRIAKSTDRRVVVWPLWRWVGRSIALSAQSANYLRGRPSFLSLDKVREAVASSWACSPAKARQQLGFEPSLGLDERLRQTVDWYKDNDWL